MPVRQIVATELWCHYRGVWETLEEPASVFWWHKWSEDQQCLEKLVLEWDKGEGESRA